MSVRSPWPEENGKFLILELLHSVSFVHCAFSVLTFLTFVRSLALFTSESSLADERMENPRAEYWYHVLYSVYCTVHGTCTLYITYLQIVANHPQFPPVRRTLAEYRYVVSSNSEQRAGSRVE